MAARITVYGTRWCGACGVAKRVLEQVGRDYDWVDIEQVPEAAERVARMNGGLRSVPTIVFGDGRVLVEPTPHQLLAALGPR